MKCHKLSPWISYSHLDVGVVEWVELYELAGEGEEDLLRLAAREPGVEVALQQVEVAVLQ